MRNTWLKLARRDPKSLSTKTKYYFCEDHFDLENDMENYTQLKIMGSVKRIRMRPNCIPSRFHHSFNNFQQKVLSKIFPLLLDIILIKSLA
ncbi:hypothetical protein HF086_006172 [Spodoptera exigua]|uniref:THAP-type domain-containing protein n=1 Tax=Spodoptera exigua TaxID=7107 RepID=A0A922MHZ5_SPOEX|nr:hypothetical protein HF086_006172 [Spodoptera exigua]